MKLRRNLTALVLGLSTIAAFAQTDGNTETRQIKEEGKTVFNPHWFMQVQAGASHTVGEAKFGDLIPNHLQVQLLAGECRCYT